MWDAKSFTPIVGTWKNRNAATRGIVSIVISEANGVLAVHAYGACVPAPCDWGEVAGIAYSLSVNGGVIRAFTAQYTRDFVTTILTGYLDNASLRVSAFDAFHYGSGRSNYFSTETFERHTSVEALPIS